MEDVGRHKIVRLEVNGQAVNAIAEEGEEIPADAHRIALLPEGLNVYADDWRLVPEGESNS